MYKIGGWIKGRTIRRQLLPDLANFCAYPSFVEEHTLGKIGKNHRLSIYTRYSSVKDFRARYAVHTQEMQLFRILVVFRGAVVYCTYSSQVSTDVMHGVRRATQSSPRKMHKLRTCCLAFTLKVHLCVFVNTGLFVTLCVYHGRLRAPRRALHGYQYRWSSI